MIKKIMPFLFIIIIAVPLLALSKADQRLIKSAERGSLAGVKQALIAGANIEARTWLGETPFLLAAGGAHIHLVKYLIKAGANFRYRTNGGNALRYASHWSNTRRGYETLKFLLEKGLDPNDSVGRLRSPIIVLASSRRYNIWSKKSVALLRKYGARTTAQDELHIAIYFMDRVAIKKAIKDGADINWKDQSGLTILNKISGSNTYPLSLFKLLLDMGADVNTKDKGGQTPLFYAVMFKGPVEFLLKAGAKTDTRQNDTKLTPLHTAASKNMLNKAKLLIKYGADINLKNFWGETPLAAARKRKHHQMVKLLKAAGGKE